MKLISEYLANDLLVTVSDRSECQQHRDYVVTVYDSLGRARHSHPFNNLREAEDYAEDYAIGYREFDIIKSRSTPT
jgi:hypothetical protein